jgi:prolyl 4-hydroxylase
MDQAPDLEQLKRDAARGIAPAQYNLGVWYLQQHGPGADYEAARVTLEAAADQGFAPAMSALGYMLLRAQGFEYDPDAAAGFFQRAAEAGFAEARYRLGEMYGAGYGRPQDSESARQCFRLAAEAGHPGAMCQLAYCYGHGLGGDRDPVAATRWYGQAALAGEPRGLCAIGWRHESGDTLTRDPVRALALYLRAAAGGYPGASMAAVRLEASLDEDVVAAARSRSREPVRLETPHDARADSGQASPRVAAWRPRCFLFPGLLSQEECFHLIGIAKPFLRAAHVLNRHTGERVVDQARRASSTRMLDPLRDMVVWNLEQRLARLAMLPPQNAEPITVLFYGPGDEYRPHRDYYDPRLPGSRVGLDQGGQRVATFLVYLNEVEAGGETLFPEAGLSFPPQTGCGLLFFNCGPDGQPDPLTLHAGAPVERGEKWLLSRWIRAGAYPIGAG